MLKGTTIAASNDPGPETGGATLAPNELGPVVGITTVETSVLGPVSGGSIAKVKFPGPVAGTFTVETIVLGPVAGTFTVETIVLGPVTGGLGGGGGGGGAPQSKLNTPVFVKSSHVKSRWLSVTRLASKTTGLGAEVRCKGSRVLDSVPHLEVRGIAKIILQLERYRLNHLDRTHLDFWRTLHRSKFQPPLPRE